MSENTAPKKAKKTHKLFVLKKARNGQHFVDIIYRNKEIGYVTEGFKRVQGAHRSIKSLMTLAYAAYTAIDGDFSRINELIDNQTEVNSPAPKKAKK